MRYLLLVALLAFVPTSVLAQSEAVVTSLTLVNADTGQPVGDLTDGTVINFAELGTNKLSVVANTNPDPVGSVAFSFDDTPDYQVESLAPYTIAGDDTTNGAVSYSTWTPSVGEHTLSATPYSESGAKGTAGTPLTVRFSVVEDNVVEGNGADGNGTDVAQATPQTTPQATPSPETSPQPEAVVVTPTPTEPAQPEPAQPTTPTTSAVDQPASGSEATGSATTARLRQERFEVTSATSPTLGGSVLVADYGLDQTIVTVLLSGVPVGETYTVRLEGSCDASAGQATMLEPVEGRTGLSANAVPLTFDELLNGYSLGIYASTSGEEVLSCTPLGR